MRIFLLAVLLMANWVSVVEAAPAAPHEVLSAAVVNVIRPNMLRFDAASRGLDSAMQALCAVPSADAVAIAAEQFALVVKAYGRIDYLLIGPLLDENRADRLLFWPDQHGVGLKQVQAILSEQDGLATDLAGLQAKSVAVQGLGALEFVLFGADAESLTSAAGAFRCTYGRAIAANIAGMAADLASGWYLPGGIADHLQQPKPDYADYRSEADAMAALVALVSHGLEGLSDEQLGPLLASADVAANPGLAVFGRSGLTMDFVRANIEGMHELIALSGTTKEAYEADQGLNNAIDFEFRNAARALDLVTLPVAEAAADHKQAEALNYLELAIRSLQAIVSKRLPAKLGLSVGFSSRDGN